MKMTLQQGDALLRQVNDLMQQGLEDLRPEPADSRVTVLHGWPVTVLAMDETEPEQDGRPPSRSTETILCQGTSIVMRSSLNGDYGYVQAEVGTGFRNGQAVMRGARRPNGGLLVWARRCSARLDGPSQMVVTWEPVARLMSVDTMPETVLPALVIRTVNQPTLEIRRSTGTLYQLAAHYTRSGLVTLYEINPYQLSPFAYTIEA